MSRNKWYNNLDPLQQEVWKEQKRQENEEIYKKMGLPKLKGTPKQIAWATAIKIKTINKVEKILQTYCEKITFEQVKVCFLGNGQPYAEEYLDGWRNKGDSLFYYEDFFHEFDFYRLQTNSAAIIECSRGVYSPLDSVLKMWCLYCDC